MTMQSLAHFNGQSQNVTMGSLELSTLTQTRHDNVKRTIEKLTEKGALKTFPQIEETSFTDVSGKRQWVKEYRLNHRDTMVVVARLNPQFMARVVDRWMELEASQAPDAATLARVKAELLAMQRKEFERNPIWVAIADLRAAGRDGAFIAQVLGITRSQQDRLVRNIRAAGLGHLLPATALPPVGAGKTLPAVDARQMALEV